LLAALDGLQILGADCEGAYLNADSREKLYTRLGPEFGEYEGRLAIITRALYWSKSAAALWRSSISGVIENLGFTMCKADNDVWMRETTNAANKKVWEYILVYSDDLLVVSHNPQEILTKINQYFKLKDGSVKPPDQYLGANIGQVDVNGTICWYMSPTMYTKSAIENIEIWLQK
jgi:Reverse transcriptase (RNA-dependent DNA polymerase)